MKKNIYILYTMILFFYYNIQVSLASDIDFFGIFPRIVEKNWYISDGWSNGEHQSCEWKKYNVSGYDGHLRLTLNNKSTKIRDFSCAEVQTKNKYSYGRYEAKLKTAVGSGLNSAFFTYVGPYQGSKIHDEIDIEFLGKNSRLVQFSYWHDGKNYDVKTYNLEFDPSLNFYSYAFEWYPDKIIWYVEGEEVHRTSGKYPIPYVPSKIMFSLWSGSESMNDWLGEFNYSEPKHMDIKWVKYTPFEINDAQ
jgi:endo-1,3-1,4-beta-glycanase ExoK